MGVVMGDNTRPSNVPAVHEVVDVLRGATRRRRKERSFSDWYTTGLAGVLAVVGLISLVAFNPWAPSGCAGPWCSAGVEGGSVAVILGLSLIVYLTGLLVGPISVNTAEAFWVFSSPVARGPLMLHRKVGLLLRTALAGVAVSFAHFWLWSSNPGWLVAFPLAAVTVSASSNRLWTTEPTPQSRRGSPTAQAWTHLRLVLETGAREVSPMEAQCVERP